MSNREKFRGVYTVVPTPLRGDERIDHAGLAHLINYYIESGCNGLLVLGSGGEFPYFNFEERVAIVKTAAKAARKRVPVLAGAGFCGLAETLAFVDAAAVPGMDGFLVILPTYHPIGIDEAVSFYTRVVSASKKPVLYYHYPQMTELFFPAAALARILLLEGIAGAKESSLNLGEIRAHLEIVKVKDFALFSGNSFSLVKTLAMGGNGVICQIPSFAPLLVTGCYEAATAGDRARADTLQRKIMDLLPFLNTFGLAPSVQKRAYSLISRMPFSLKSKNRSRHAVIKETLRQMGHPVTARVRSPLPQIGGGDREIISEFISRLKPL
ncbi:MAG: dihydrodipicolinate synthase family protein [Spirochaetes bacterium]|nr:MAG: dihydrodipicolinate synthase family protein [Spirochaetota bacterium]